MKRHIPDLNGKTFDTRKVLHRGPNSAHHAAQWYCRCSRCGTKQLVLGLTLRRGHKCRCTRSIYRVGDVVYGLVLVKKLQSMPPKYLYERPCGHRIVSYAPSTLEDRASRQCGKCGDYHHPTYEHDGCKLTAQEWATKLGIDLGTFHSRRHQLGVDDPRIFTPGRLPTPNRRMLRTASGPVGESDAARALGISRQAVDLRLKHGWSEEAAATTPKHATLHEKRGHYRCRKCGQLGHRAKTCDRPESRRR